MPLTKSFNETIKARLQESAGFVEHFSVTRSGA